jgi:2-iminobutanoate/2-iminopropanoate deaminase
MSQLEFVHSSEAPEPLGHYSQAVFVDSVLYISGQLPIDPHNPSACFETPESQTTQTLKNLEAVLIASGGRKEMIVKVTIYISDIAIWPQVNSSYAAFFGAHRPARTAVPVPALPKGLMVEIDAIAHINKLGATDLQS